MCPGDAILLEKLPSGERRIQCHQLRRCPRTRLAGQQQFPTPDLPLIDQWRYVVTLQTPPFSLAVADTSETERQNNHTV